jgi:hypothetical protein
MNKLNYSPELKEMLENFLIERKIKCFMDVLSTVLYASVSILIFRGATSFLAWFVYFWMLLECIAFFRLYRVDNVFRSRFENGTMFKKDSERRIFLIWASKGGVTKLQRATLLLREAFDLADKFNREKQTE